MNKNIYESINENNIFFGNNESFLSPQMKSPNYNLYNSNNINSINTFEEENLRNFNNVNDMESYYLINKSELEKKIIAKNSTLIKTNEESNEPELCISNDILSFLNKKQNKDILGEIIKKLKFSEYIEDDLNLTKKKRLRPFDFDALILNKNIKSDEGKKKRGRKAKENKRKSHDKNCPDNIIKKVKVIIFNYTLLFLNNILNQNLKHKVELLKLDYKYINRIQKVHELNFLSMKLKDIFSKDISPKYNYKKDYNKKKIKKILNDADDIILFAFNMTLRDWLDIFTKKKSVKDIINKNNNNINCKNLIEKIEQSLTGFEQILKKINENNDEDYMTRFIFCLYNYERWFYLKKSRKAKKK